MDKNGQEGRTASSEVEDYLEVMITPFFDHRSIDDHEERSFVFDEVDWRRRLPNELRRPVIIDALDVGYSYRKSQQQHDGGDSTTTQQLHVRAITETLWFFVLRGHRSIALLPFAYHRPEKLSNPTELDTLERLGLVQFVHLSTSAMGMAQELVTGACKTGGCIVSRRQMHDVPLRWPHFKPIVESRLLMPTFVGVNRSLTFPMDGPLGRMGDSFHSTIRADATLTDPCSAFQMTLAEQQLIMGELAQIDKRRPWTTLVDKLKEIRPNLRPCASSPKMKSRKSSVSSSTSSSNEEGPPPRSPQAIAPPPVSDEEESWEEEENGELPAPFNQLAEIFSYTQARFIMQLLPHEKSLQALVEFAMDAQAHGNLPQAEQQEEEEDSDLIIWE